MEHDNQREIFERLEALERLVRSRSGEHGGRDEHRRGDRDRHDRGGRDRHDHGGRDRHDHEGRDRHEHGGRDRHDHDHHRGRGGDDFQEKRIVDTIVRLVGERVERFIQDHHAKTQPRDDDGREKRVVDLVVRLVSEHVREIVQETLSTELDRRFGRGEPSPEQG